MAQENEVAEFRQLLATVIRLLAAQVSPSLPISERAPLLAGLGLDRNAIAAVCRTTPDVISVRLAEAKRGEKKKASKKRSPNGAVASVAVSPDGNPQPEEL